MKKLTNLLSLNKQANIIAAILLLMSLCFVSCGGDDDSSNSKVVDGVNVNTGRKLVRLDIHEPINNSYFGLEEYIYKLRIDYDSKGRLSRVILTNDYKYENGKYVEIDATNMWLLLDLSKHMMYQARFADSSRSNQRDVTFIIQPLYYFLGFSLTVAKVFCTFIAIYHKRIV